MLSLKSRLTVFFFNFSTSKMCYLLAYTVSYENLCHPYLCSYVYYVSFSPLATFKILLFVIDVEQNDCYVPSCSFLSCFLCLGFTELLRCGVTIFTKFGDFSIIITSSVLSFLSLLQRLQLHVTGHWKSPHSSLMFFCSFSFWRASIVVQWSFLNNV